MFRANKIFDFRKSTTDVAILDASYSSTTKRMTFTRSTGGTFDVDLATLQDILTVVETFAELPDPTLNIGELAVVTTTTGIIGLTRKQAGMYFSDGVTWKRLDVNYNAEQTYYNNVDGNLVALNVKAALDELSIELATKQDTLVNQVNIKSINGDTLLGSGNLDISAGSGGYSANVYLTDLVSTTNPSYKQLSYTPDATQTTISAITNNNTVLIEDFIFDGDVNTTILPAGQWVFAFFRSVDNTGQTTTVRFDVFSRASNGDETVLFSVSSKDINDVTPTREEINYTQASLINVNETDRIGVKIYATTNRTSDTIVSIRVGDGEASWFTTPLEIRHNQLRARDQADAHPINAITGLQNELDFKATKAELTNGTVDAVFNDLTVNGTTTTINSTTLTVDDKNIELGSVASPSDITADGGGITLKGATDKTIIWSSATDSWSFNKDVRFKQSGEVQPVISSNTTSTLITSDFLGATGSSKLEFQTAENTDAPTTKMTILGNGDVGLGVNPKGALQVNHAADVNLLVKGENETAGAVTINAVTDNDGFNIPLEIRSSLTTFTNGNVLIGTSTDSGAKFKAEIDNNTNLPIADFKNVAGSGTDRDAYIRLQLSTDNYSIGHHASTNSFQICNAPNLDTNSRMTINSAGNVLFGTTSSSGIGAKRVEIKSEADAETSNLLLNTFNRGYWGVYQAGDYNSYMYRTQSRELRIGRADIDTNNFNYDIIIDADGNTNIQNDLNYNGNLSHSMGELYAIDNATETVITATNTWAKVNILSTTLSINENFDDGLGISQRLRYTGATTRMFHVASSFSYSVNGTNQIIEFAVFKNGALIPSSIVRQQVAQSGFVGSTAMHVVATMAQNDYIEVYCRNTSGSSNITISNLNFVAMNAN